MYNKNIETLDFINNKIWMRPKIAIILGSGLGELVNYIDKKEYLDYKEIPHFPVSTVEGHIGRLVFGEIGGVEVMAMQGRFHYYEGYTMKDVAYPVFFMKMFGIEKLIVSNAAGGINQSFDPGDLMLITDHINLMGNNPLIGHNDEKFGSRFPDMSEPYCKSMMEKADSAALKAGITNKRGVYAAVTGPYYETAAEIKYMGIIGADAVGMSTVPEVITANYLGMKVLGISCITNMATGIAKEKHSHEEVVKTAKDASEKFCRWIAEIVVDIGK